ncbi:MAG: type I methionyl aminopeptidase [Candidatus Nomurabacteria bacterium]|jgi:methionyl aminopeptidase|nr:type I methionyl aminopeptidase [Candidatus Nomurabacteria bacterium]
MNKTLEQIEAQRQGGKIMASIFQKLRERAKAGVNELALNDFVAEEIIRQGAVASYTEQADDFSGVICISVNDELIHGSPEDNILRDGDKVSFDLTIGYRGMCVDSAFTMVIGDKMTAAQKHLISATEQSFWAGIRGIKAGSTTGDIGFQVEQVLNKAKLGIVKEYIGHGIGEKIHEPPEVPNYGKRKTGVVLKVGDTICVEPMTSLGSPKTVVGSDGWTVFLKDGSLGAHYEHTILITEKGVEVLTK